MTFARSASPRRRRGIALLLVLAVLAGVTVLTAGALTMQQSAPDVGVNAVSEVRARWSAESAANISVAVLQTSFDFSGANGDLMTGQTVTDGASTVKVTTVDGAPPSDADRVLVLTSTSQVNGVHRTVRKLVTLAEKTAPTKAFDSSYSEFAAVVGDQLTIKAGATVARWGMSPEAKATGPIGIGAFCADGSKVDIDAGANTRGAALYCLKDANAKLTSQLSATRLAAGGFQLPYSLPLTPEFRPGDLASLPVAQSKDYSVSGAGTVEELKGGLYQNLTVDKGAVAIIGAADGLRYSFNNLKIDDGSTLMIRGLALVQVRGQLQVTNLSCVALEDDSSGVSFFTEDDVTIKDSGVGINPKVAQDTARSVSSLSSYTLPSRVRMFAQPKSLGAKDTPKYTLDSSALVLASIHSPTAEVQLQHTSTLVGRVTGSKLTLDSDTSLYYDPSLDPRCGFRVKTGVFYDASGAPLADLATKLAAFDVGLGADVLRSQVQSLVALDTTTGAVAALSTTLSVAGVTEVTVEPADRTFRTTEVQALPDPTGL